MDKYEYRSLPAPPPPCPNCGALLGPKIDGKSFTCPVCEVGVIKSTEDTIRVFNHPPVLPESIGETIDSLSSWIYESVKAKGFHENIEDKLAESIAIYIASEMNKPGEWGDVREFAKRLGGVVRANYTCDAGRMMLMVSELAEAMEGVRKPGLSDKIPGFTIEEEELADAMYRILDYAGKHKLNLGDAFMAKYAYNQGRPYKHGKKF